MNDSGIDAARALDAGPPASRRSFLAAAAAGTLVTTALSRPALAQDAAGPAGPPSAAPPRPVVAQSTAEHALQIISTRRLEDDAKAAMPPGAYAFVSGGAGDEVTLRLNQSELAGYLIRPHRLAGLLQSDLRTRVLGQDLAYPLYITPMGGHDIVHAEAEIATARGAGAAGALMVVSGASNRPMELIAKAGAGPKWFQLYMNVDPAVNRALLTRARAAGYTAVVMTIDAIGPGSSEAYLAMGSPRSPTPGIGNDDPRFGGFGRFIDLKKDFSPRDIAFVREASGGLPVLVKGILRPDDAVMCLKAGAAGVIVSNHGGRQMDGTPAAITCLRPVVEAVAGRGPVLFDSGVRRGIDVLRALALGASAVGIGRPVLYGLALGGGAGVRSVLETLRDETALAMRLSGARDIKALSPDFLERKA